MAKEFHMPPIKPTISEIGGETIDVTSSMLLPENPFFAYFAQDGGGAMIFPDPEQVRKERENKFNTAEDVMLVSQIQVKRGDTRFLTDEDRNQIISGSLLLQETYPKLPSISRAVILDCTNRASYVESEDQNSEVQLTEIGLQMIIACPEFIQDKETTSKLTSSNLETKLQTIRESMRFGTDEDKAILYGIMQLMIKEEPTLDREASSAGLLENILEDLRKGYEREEEKKKTKKLPPIEDLQIEDLGDVQLPDMPTIQMPVVENPQKKKPGDPLDAFTRWLKRHKRPNELI